MIHLVDQQPIWLNMALAHILVIPGIGQVVVMIFLRQGPFCLQDAHHFLQLRRIAASLKRQLVISL